MNKKENNKTTSFGFEAVTEEEKTGKVKEVFDSVATNYDLMNDLMSMGIHRLWKRFMLSQTGLKIGMKALDVAGGTGDIAALLREQVGESGLVVMTDINPSMLKEGRSRLLDRGKLKNIQVIQCDAESLPFDDDHFDCVTIAFGLRNVTVKENALKSMFRVLKPGGRMLILEFSKPNEMISPAYDLYSFNILPTLGEWVANDRESYQYLAESIRVHPDQKKLEQMILSAGFDRAEYQNLTGGIVALHIGYKD
ncbi:MAG: bifunctional demethylmenaquinone methyltransferase/2-methoxy-6-polyprenyl-1,4-benzoquinol methylase UbiE [Gammaproteobacteria bacterium]|jgi:demethylmenaquinone methyltransferase/2-methoxy-6-polyprenyl-1,4-benzoquinol methylase|nr:bifunctional demethylmenaquinone methyltransferase/2-methoxy-6-polyprenyl-1,4-benzoquinol methylase UbiE [Gammaproteobacteria bacterium]MDP6146319.1 bifunctional demethylmenaquinone methyltransferase/2-methoxy-6-polyprenyl-1,4-benzoquinol methylase UbiE [Gammaproteobacteria bacterium]HJL79918.1 bifunctional demethylmenaquinone methyltransferase/2-methoxy-6-polyprenyl-1,4-benzoquinol methylase UbiE [Gammaproteobacteria bacterium]HJM08876.1 bifunctional demethylmenaquinone methyltransferase/2-m|tara:strand:- start:3478 stop:4233 length:756 start_codon:yes stop_codon:yes gene_type:complete